MIYKFDELFTWKSGKAIEESEGTIPIYGSNGIIGYTNIAKYKNKIILGRVGAYCGSVEYCNTEFNATDNTLITECDENLIKYKYAYYLLKLYNLNKFAGGSAQPLITQGILKHLKCDLPDINFQDKVSSILSKYDDIIQNNNKCIEILEKIIEKIYKKIFSYKKLENIKTTRLKDIITIIRGISYSSEEIDCDKGINLINLKNINAFGGFRRDGTKKYCGKYKETQIVKYGDLIMGVTDMTQDRRTVGHVALIPELEDTSVISADLVKIESNINKYYLYSMFKYGNVSKYLSQFANGANVLHLKPSSIENIKIQLPSQDKINKYINLAEPIFNEINIINKKNDNLIKQRDLLLPRLISGKLKV